MPGGLFYNQPFHRFFAHLEARRINESKLV
jgi:hypothetical protein